MIRINNIRSNKSIIKSYKVNTIQFNITIYTTIVSLMTKKPVKKTVAMTGEITLRGKVLPIGGLKEKLLAASRGGIKTVLIPIDNVKDLKEIPDNIKNTLEIIPVSKIEEVLKNALV